MRPVRDAQRFLTALLFTLTAAPLVAQEGGACLECETAGYPIRSDVNADGKVDISDATSLLGWLFTGGAPPACPSADGAPGAIAETPGCCADCGDANGDVLLDLSDAVHILVWLFAGGDEPGCAPASTEGCVAPTAIIVDAVWLAQRLDDESVQIVDVRSSSMHASSRIPGALHLNGNALRATRDGVSGQVALPAVVEAALRTAGLRRDATVVVYGTRTDTSSARVVWTLEHNGHPDVRLLDGGFGAWTSGDFPIDESALVAPTSSDYNVEPIREDLRVTADWIAARLDDPLLVLVNARSSGEYAGGHLPGAISVDWNRNVTAAGALRGVDEVAALYEGIDPAATVVAYCQTGSRASVAYVVLRWLGFADVRLYDGSWSEWGSRAELPREP